MKARHTCMPGLLFGKKQKTPQRLFSIEKLNGRQRTVRTLHSGAVWIPQKAVLLERIFFEKKDVSKVHSASEHGLRQTPHHVQRTAQAPASRSSNFYGDEEASSGKTCNGSMHKKRRRPTRTTKKKKKKKKKKGLFPALFRSPSFPFCGSPQERRLVPRANGEWVALQKNPLTYGKFTVWSPRMPLRVLVWASRSFRTNRPSRTRSNVG